MKHNVYFDGRVESLGLDTAAGYATVGVITPGTYTFPTEFEEHVRVTSGVLRQKFRAAGQRSLAEILARHAAARLIARVVPRAAPAACRLRLEAHRGRAGSRLPVRKSACWAAKHKVLCKIKYGPHTTNISPAHRPHPAALAEIPPRAPPRRPARFRPVAGARPLLRLLGHLRRSRQPPVETILLAIALDQQKAIEDLQRRLGVPDATHRLDSRPLSLPAGDDPWILDRERRRHRLIDPFTPSFYVGGPEAALKRLADRLRAWRLARSCEFTYQRDLWSGRFESRQ